MRALHLFFRLHRPYQLKPLDEIKSGYFGGEAEFREANRTEYQPFLALLERNAQKYPNFKVSLSVSGLFLEQAEAWDKEIIRRLHRLVKNGHVQLTVEPYDYSLAMFYSQEEFERQVERHKKKLEQLFGGDLSVLALPELIYNDKLATWADKAGYKGIIAGAADKILDWRSTSQVYAAASCKELRTIFQNTLFSRAIMTGNEDFLMVEEAIRPVDFQMTTDTTTYTNKATTRRTANKMSAADFVEAMSHKKHRPTSAEDESKKHPGVMRGPMKFSAHKFKRRLDIEMLRGNLMNICLDTGIFAEFHSAGVIRFFDDLIGNWLKSSNNCFMTASEILRKFEPDARLAVPVTVNWRGEFELVKKEALSVLDEVQACPPEWLRFQRQVEASKTLYRLRKNVERTNDEALYEDFSRLTALDYLLNMSTQTPPLVGANDKKVDEQEARTFSGYFLTIIEDLAIRIREKTPESLALESGELEEKAMADSDKQNDGVSDPEPDEDFSVEVHRIIHKDKPPKTESAVTQGNDGEVEVHFGRQKEDDELGWGGAVIEDDMEIIAYSEEELARYFAKKMNLEIEEVDEDAEDSNSSEEEQVLAERLMQKRNEIEQDVDSLAEAELVVEELKSAKRKKRRKFVVE